MRIDLRLLLLLLLAGCSSTEGARKVEDTAYARAAEYQSMDAYQRCTEENVGDEKKCDALIRLLENDRNRVEKVAGAK
jgi:hypothetical protein